MHIIINLLMCVAIYLAPGVASVSTKPPGVDSNELPLHELRPAVPIDECVNNSVDSKCSSAHEASSHLSNLHMGDQSQQGDGAQEIDRLVVNSAMLDQDFHQNLSPELARVTEPTIRQVIFIHRHGDRTPITFMPKDILKGNPFWTFHGLGQLTNRGKARLYLLGKITRQRYGQFLGNSVNKNIRMSRSSGSLRCIESAQMFLAGFLSLDEPDSSDAKFLVWDQHNSLANLWQSVNILSVPAAMDGMLAESAQCEALSNEYLNVIDKSEEVRLINSTYKPEAEVLNLFLGYEMDHFYKWFWSASQIEVERSYFMDKMQPQVLSIYDRVQEAGDLALGAYQRTSKSRRLRSGLLISDMIQNMRNFRDMYRHLDDDVVQSKKFVHYSAHDLTLVVLLGMLNSWDKYPHRPGYGSNIAIELHQDKKEWFVKLFYMAEVPAEPVELHIARCEVAHPTSRCLLDRFEELMSQYMIPSWQAWMKECNNDMSKIDPYAPAS